jgi:Mo-dependent nitrogenase C-terminus
VVITVKISNLQTLVHQRFDDIEVHDRKTAHLFCKMIPASCPFEQDIKLFNRTLFHIPPLCKLNPLYEEMVTLRFKSLSYLADECGEDITLYY